MSLTELVEPIRILGDPILRQVADPVESFDTETSDVINECFKTLRSYGDSAAAVAAPQIGYPKRLFVMANNEVAINPKIVGIESDKSWLYAEGCLSIPGMYWYVSRPKTIRVNYQTHQGTTMSRVFSEFDARIFQHEIDHLDGRLVLDLLPEQALKKLAKDIMDDIILALIDGREVPQKKLRSLPPWRAVMMAQLANRIGSMTDESVWALIEEASHVGGDGELSNL